MGSGRQYISWLHEIDFCRAMEWIIEHETLADAVNVTSPHPVTNERLMSALRELCGRRIGLPASQWMLEVGAFFLRTETELIIKSRRVVPTKLLTSGFRFNFPEIREALAELNQRVAAV